MSAKSLWLTGVLLFLAAGAGFAGGAVWRFGPPWPLAAGHEDDHEEHADEHDHDAVHLTEAAYHNLGLNLLTVELSDYEQVLRVPGRIVERPGHTTHALTSPVSGIVMHIYASEGMTLAPGAPLFSLQVIDQELLEAQMDLLNILTRIEVIAAEEERLARLTDVVAGRRQLDLDYERKQLDAKRDVRIQELYQRGLNADQVEQVVGGRQLLRELTVRLPTHGRSMTSHIPNTSQALPAGGAETATVENVLPSVWKPATDGGATQASHNTAGGQVDLTHHVTVQGLSAFPGKSVQRGYELCALAIHGELYIQGQAFENDLAVINHAMEQDWPLAAEFGSPGDRTYREELSVRYVDNHVDDHSQTFLFYVPLANEIARQVLDAEGHRYVTWRFKVGQRVHLLVPVARFSGQIKLPRDAVVQEGPNRYVFRRHEHEEESGAVTHTHGGTTHMHDVTSLPLSQQQFGGEAVSPPVEEAHEDDHEHEDVFAEFEPVPVRIAHEDERFVVVAADSELALGEEIAANNAYQLYLAWKAQMQPGGGGHDHHHH